MTLYCIGRNYAAHAAELGNAIPDEPVVFTKPATALIPQGEDFRLPAFSTDIHYECELVYRICKPAKNVAEVDAHNYIDAVTLGIDFTARDLQTKLKDKGLPWEKSKAWDGSAAVGEWKSIVEALGEKSIRFQFFKNDTLVQDGDSGLMLHSIDALIADLSKYFTLLPGDFIFTGTPAGVGPVAPGDVLKAVLQEATVLEMKCRE